MNPREHGFALMTVLFISALLSALALGYATTARFKALQVKNGLDRIQKGLRLESCLELGWHEFLKYQANKSLLANEESVEKLADADLELWYPRQEPYMALVDGEEYSIQLLNESAKLSVTSLNSDGWTDVLQLCGLDEKEAAAILDAILDYVDSDELHRINGAENDYYLGLAAPYECKDNEIETLEELLLIKGITPSIYYGTNEHPGLVDFLTVLGNAQSMDINSAPRSSFAIVEGLPAEVIDEIIALRQESPIKKMDDLVDVVPYEYFDLLKKYFAVRPVAYLTITAWPSAAGRDVGPRLQRTYSVK